MSAMYRWTVKVKRYNTYGDKVASTTPATVLAANRDEVTAKVRAAFNATYDDFRKFWSHGWALERVDEVTPPPQPDATPDPVGETSESEPEESGA